MSGLSEHDTFLCNQIREGRITRETALEKSLEMNRPRLDSLRWYFRTIGVDMNYAIATVNKIKKLY